MHSDSALDVGPERAKIAQRPRQQIKRRGQSSSEPQFLCLRLAAKVCLESSHLVEQVLAEQQERASLLRELQPAGVACVELHSELVLELPDLSVQGRLRNVHLPRRGAEVERARERQEPA